MALAITEINMAITDRNKEGMLVAIDSNKGMVITIIHSKVILIINSLGRINMIKVWVRRIALVDKKQILDRICHKLVVNSLLRLLTVVAVMRDRLHL